MARYGKTRFDLILQPVSGKAVPVHRGEVLRVTLIEGPQCVDFNCFNLNDYKEHMSVGHIRSIEGFRPKKGSVLMSNPPRYNPMMAIIEMPETCVAEALGARCWASLYEMLYGMDNHPNCQDTFAECIGEYGLTPDDVHDSFNMWFNTGWLDDGTYITTARRNTGKRGDHVDLLGLMDVLAVPVICGSHRKACNYLNKPIQIQIFDASDATNKLTEDYLRKYTALKTRRTLGSFRIKDIRTERALKPIPGYKPHFIKFPLKRREFTIELTDKEYEEVQRLKMRGLGEDDEDVIRSAVMEWYEANRLLWS